MFWNGLHVLIFCAFGSFFLWAFYIIIVGIRGICIAKSQRKQLEAEEEEYAEFIKKQLEYQSPGGKGSYQMIEMDGVGDAPKFVRAIRSTARVLVAPVDPLLTVSSN